MEDRRPRGDVLAGLAQIGPALDAGRDDDLAAFLAAVLLHHDRVRARRYRRAGEDADRLATVRGAAQRMAGGGTAGDR